MQPDRYTEHFRRDKWRSTLDPPENEDEKIVVKGPDTEPFVSTLAEEMAEKRWGAEITEWIDLP